MPVMRWCSKSIKSRVDAWRCLKSSHTLVDERKLEHAERWWKLRVFLPSLLPLNDFQAAEPWLHVFCARPMDPLPRVLPRSRRLRCKDYAKFFPEPSHLKGSEPARAADFRWQARVLGQEMIPWLKDGCTHLLWIWTLQSPHHALEPSWQLSPLATTAVVIHLQWMLDRNKVQSVYIHLFALYQAQEKAIATACAFQNNLMNSVFVESSSSKKSAMAKPQTVAAFSGGTKILTVSQWAPAKANGVPSINRLRIEMIHVELLLPMYPSKILDLWHFDTNSPKSQPCANHGWGGRSASETLWPWATAAVWRVTSINFSDSTG